MNYYYFFRELRNLEKKSVENRARKKLKEAKDLQRNLEQGKKLKKCYQIDNVLIKATISLQTKLTEITEEGAFRLLLEKGTTGRRGFSVWSRTGTWTRAKRGPSTGPRTWWRSCSRR